MSGRYMITVALASTNALALAAAGGIGRARRRGHAPRKDIVAARTARSVIPRSVLIVRVLGVSGALCVLALVVAMVGSAPALGARQAAGLDVGRITQGLDRDTRANVVPDLVAGKETLARAQVFGPGAPQIDRAECRIRPFFFPPPPKPPPVRTVPAQWSGTGTARLNPAAKGRFDGSPTFSCWIPGTTVPVEGNYEIVLWLWVHGESNPQPVPLGTKSFFPAADIRLLIYPWMFPPSNPQYRKFSMESVKVLARTMLDFQRIWPARAGAGRLADVRDPLGKVQPGVRYLMAPPYQCNKPAKGSLDCDLETRNNAELMRTQLNADHPNDVTPDMLDWAYTLAQVPTSGGGSSCWSGQRTAGGAQDLKGPDTSYQANIMVQELSHCLGAVAATSPNSQPGNPRHAKTALIPLGGQPPAVNFVTREDRPAPTSVMFGNVRLDTSAFFEGQEWNQIRVATAATSLGSSGTARMTAEAARGQAFIFAGSIDRKDRVSRQYSGVRPFDGRFEQPPSATPYALVFRDGQGNSLGRYPFNVSFDTTHEHVGRLPLFLAAPTAAGARSVVIVKGEKELHRVSITTARPRVSRVRLYRVAGGLRATWRGADRDSTRLAYAVSYRRDRGAPLLLVAGLLRRSFTLPTRYSAPSRRARLIIEASDGFNTGTARSRAFRVRARRPTVEIVTPRRRSHLRANALVIFAGLAFDLDAGQLDSQALQWFVDGRRAWRGNRLSRRLRRGRHVIVLRARAPSGLRATAVRRVRVTRR